MFRALGKKKAKPDTINEDRGILVFENTTEVIRAENILKNRRKVEDNMENRFMLTKNARAAG